MSATEAVEYGVVDQVFSRDKNKNGQGS